MKSSNTAKIELVKSLNWDYNISAEDILDVVENRKIKAGAFDKESIFLRSLERLNWSDIITLWDMEDMKNLYTSELSSKLFPRSLKQKYDITFSILRKHPVPFAGWGSERARKMQNTFLSHRWDRFK
ncbi:MAG: hypothetical protein LBQ31_10220 [Bacteroidales bacterium]|jgi:hypothetical protein|nr:hypothetical protein [Bacteroidales bacterium]